MSNMNKLKSFGLDWMVVRSEEDYCAIFSKSKISLTLLFFILYKVFKREFEIKNSTLFHLFPDYSSPPYLHLFQIFLCWNFLQHIISLAIKVCFLSFYTYSSCFVEENRLMNVWYLDIPFFAWIHVYLCLIDMN